jgi:hypothetical protein
MVSTDRDAQSHCERTVFDWEKHFHSEPLRWGTIDGPFIILRTAFMSTIQIDEQNWRTSGEVGPSAV